MKRLLLAAAVILSLIFEGHESREVILCLTGDIMLDRGVEAEILENGYDYPYSGVKDILIDADITFGNLECPITDRGTPLKKEYVFRALPSNAAALKGAGYDILNLANNHSMDYGWEGLYDTVKILRECGIYSTGISLGRKGAQKPAIVKRSGIRVGFLGYSDFPPDSYMSRNYGYNICHAEEFPIRQDVIEARNSCDFLVVSFHFGNEYDYYPDKKQKAYARLAVDSGADMVVGHHPHVLQGIERYNGKYIFYSLGNFIFDRQVQNGTDETVILNVKIDGEGLKGFEMLPVKIANSRPYIAGESGEYIFQRLKLYSEGIN